MENRNKTSKNKKEDYLLRIRDEILLDEESEYKEELLKFIDMEIELLYEKGHINDPSFLLRKGFFVKEIQ